MENNKSNTRSDHSVKTSQTLILERVARFCPHCGSPYSAEDAKILRNSESRIIIHFSCNVCKHSFLATLTVPDPHHSFMEASTNMFPLGFNDLKERELARFIRRQPITADTVVDIDSFINRKGGRLRI